MGRKKSAVGTRPFQIKMDEQAHGLLKHRAQQLEKTIGELIENLLSSLELRVEKAKTKVAIAPSLRNDKLDAMLIRFLLRCDKENLSQQEIKNGLSVIKKDFESRVYQPTITID